LKTDSVVGIAEEVASADPTDSDRFQIKDIGLVDEMEYDLLMEVSRLREVRQNEKPSWTEKYKYKMLRQKK
jgi:hypothetical protein